jgi:hypothetical protein
MLADFNAGDIVIQAATEAPAKTEPHKAAWSIVSLLNPGKPKPNFERLLMRVCMTPPGSWIGQPVVRSLPRASGVNTGGNFPSQRAEHGLDIPQTQFGEVARTDRW